ncbi:uncharacterized protein LOC113549784 [Rhopalosiphum maidis]|uniref:uncharacterized protein LOC113549784 n=1 Tax=Rhopalosiphum maidis TaxID=43146 RepID=UPI000EFDEF63|nr:uncharacterized protein LOC113549784 [Rhopalosiphum maidis]
MVAASFCQCFAFYEYILLILYIQWMVYMINKQILEKGSSLCILRDMHLEVVECLKDINRSIYGLSAVVSFIASNICQIILTLYYHVIFSRNIYIEGEFLYAIISILTRLINIMVLYGIGHATEKEINRMSLVLHKRSIIENNPRIKRQIKFFILRRLHEYYHFELYGICQINPRQLLILSNKAFAYLVIQTLFKLNKK